MAALINIAGTNPVHDPAYRYKMPKLLAKVEGRGNGIKTVLLNVDDIALALKRDAPEVTKFFGCELGAQTTYTDRAIVNGAHREPDLQTHLSKYIENFVLCRNCHLPETHYKCKDEIISQKCLACGHKESVDMTHKLTTFILASYKRAKDAAKAADKASKKGDKDKKDKKDKKEKSSADTGDAEDKKEKKDKKYKKEKKEKKDKSSSDNLAGAVEDTADGVPETVFSSLSLKDEAVAAEDDEEEESEEKVLDDAINRLRIFLDDRPNATIEQKLDEIRGIQIAFALRPADRCIVYLGATFTEACVVENAVDKDKVFLSHLASSDILQRHLLAAFEWLCGVKYPALNTLTSFSKLLMQTYEAEVVDEEVFLLWSADTVRNEFSAHASVITYETLESLRSHAQPFVAWLQTADESGDEEEDDDEEDEEGA